MPIYFQGRGARWAGVVGNADHPVHALYSAVADTVADVFGSRDEAEQNGFDLITDNSVPVPSGLPSIVQLAGQGDTIFGF